jgi:hypothetical protein
MPMNISLLSTNSCCVLRPWHTQPIINDTDIVSNKRDTIPYRYHRQFCRAGRYKTHGLWKKAED